MLLCNSAAGQLYMNDGVYIPEDAVIHSNEVVRIGDSSTVYNNGTIQSNEQVLGGGDNFIRMGSSARVITTLPGGQAWTLPIGIHSNNRMILQHAGTLPQAYSAGIYTPVFDNPENATSTIPSGIANRTWQLTPLTQQGTTDIALAWNAAEEISINRDSIAIATWQQGSSNKWLRHGHAPAVNTGGDPAYERSISLPMNAGDVYYFHITDTTTPAGIISTATLNHVRDFKVYPNPANSTVYYSFSANNGLYRIALYDLSGKCISVNDHRTANNLVYGSIDVSALASGMYLLTLQEDDKLVKTQRLVIR